MCAAPGCTLSGRFGC